MNVWLTPVASDTIARGAHCVRKRDADFVCVSNPRSKSELAFRYHVVGIPVILCIPRHDEGAAGFQFHGQVSRCDWKHVSLSAGLQLVQA